MFLVIVICFMVISIIYSVKKYIKKFLRDIGCYIDSDNNNEDKR